VHLFVQTREREPEVSATEIRNVEIIAPRSYFGVLRLLWVIFHSSGPSLVSPSGVNGGACGTESFWLRVRMHECVEGGRADACKRVGRIRKNAASFV
jgi:hypothetical protein